MAKLILKIALFFLAASSFASPEPLYAQERSGPLIFVLADNNTSERAELETILRSLFPDRQTLVLERRSESEDHEVVNRQTLHSVFDLSSSAGFLERALDLNVRVSSCQFAMLQRMLQALQMDSELFDESWVETEDTLFRRQISLSESSFEAYRRSRLMNEILLRGEQSLANPLDNELRSIGSRVSPAEPLLSNQLIQAIKAHLSRAKTNERELKTAQVLLASRVWKIESPESSIQFAQAIEDLDREQMNKLIEKAREAQYTRTEWLKELAVETNETAEQSTGLSLETAATRTFYESSKDPLIKKIGWGLSLSRKQNQELYDRLKTSSRSEIVNTTPELHLIWLAVRVRESNSTDDLQAERFHQDFQTALLNQLSRAHPIAESAIRQALFYLVASEPFDQAQSFDEENTRLRNLVEAPEFIDDLREGRIPLELPEQLFRAQTRLVRIARHIREEKTKTETNESRERPDRNANTQDSSVEQVHDRVLLGPLGLRLATPPSPTKVRRHIETQEITRWATLLSRLQAPHTSNRVARTTIYYRDFGDEQLKLDTNAFERIGDFSGLIALDQYVRQTDYDQNKYWSALVRELGKEDDSISQPPTELQLMIEAWRFNPIVYDDNFFVSSVRSARRERLYKPIIRKLFSDDVKAQQAARRLLKIHFANRYSMLGLELDPNATKSLAGWIHWLETAELSELRDWIRHRSWKAPIQLSAIPSYAAIHEDLFRAADELATEVRVSTMDDSPTPQFLTTRVETDEARLNEAKAHEAFLAALINQNPERMALILSHKTLSPQLQGLSLERIIRQLASPEVAKTLVESMSEGPLKSECVRSLKAAYGLSTQP